MAPYAYFLLVLNIVLICVNLINAPTPVPMPIWGYAVMAVFFLPVYLKLEKDRERISFLWLTTYVAWVLMNLIGAGVNKALSYSTMTAHSAIALFLEIVALTAVIVVAIVAKIQLKIGSGIKEEKEQINMEAIKKELINDYKSKEYKKPYEWFNLQICMDALTKTPVFIEGMDRFLHSLIVGTTGAGKTSRVIKPQIIEDLLRIKAGQKMGVTVIEPSGDLAGDIAEICKKMGIPCVHIDLSDPDHSDHFNIMEGNAIDVAETTRSVLKDLFGKQDAFFSQVQQTSARNIVLMLKKLKGDDLNLIDVVRALRDMETMEKLVKKLNYLEPNSDLVQYFEKELLGSMKDKYLQFAIGLRQQLEDITGNEKIRKIITGKSSINLDQHFAEGGVLVVNTALEMGAVGSTFGKFLIGQIKAAIFRRPGTERTRIPHHWIIDEFPKYVTSEFRDVLGIARKYRCAATLAVQCIDDIGIVDKSLTDIILNNCHHKIIFGSMSGKDGLFWEKDFGKKTVEVKNGDKLVEKEVARFPQTYLMELKPFQFIYKIAKNNQLQVPREGIGSLANIEEMSIDEILEQSKTEFTFINKVTKIVNENQFGEQIEKVKKDYQNGKKVTEIIKDHLPKMGEIKINIERGEQKKVNFSKNDIKKEEKVEVMNNQSIKEKINIIVNKEPEMAKETFSKELSDKEIKEILAEAEKITVQKETIKEVEKKDMKELLAVQAKITTATATTPKPDTTRDENWKEIEQKQSFDEEMAEDDFWNN